MHKADKPFSGTEVAVLIESFRNDIALLAEGQNAIHEDVQILKQDTAEIKMRLTTVEDVIRVAIPQIHVRLSRLETKVGIV